MQCLSADQHINHEAGDTLKQLRFKTGQISHFPLVMKSIHSYGDADIRDPQ